MYNKIISIIQKAHNIRIIIKVIISDRDHKIGVDGIQ